MPVQTGYSFTGPRVNLDTASGMRGRLRQIGPWLGPLVGLVGISLAIYFRLESIQERAPVYYVHPGRAKLLDATAPIPSQLQILLRGQPIKGKSVIAVRLYFWNEGRVPIRKEDILQPLAFELKAPSEILEVRLLKQSRDVVKFTLGQIKATSRNVLPISFEILEKSDGASIQIIYTGEETAPIALKGTIVGVSVPKLSRAASLERYYKRPSLSESRSTEEKFASYMILGSSIVFLGGIIFYSLRYLPLKKRLYRLSCG